MNTRSTRRSGSSAISPPLGFADPEGWYLYAFRLFPQINGAEGPALEYVQRAVDGGYVLHEPLITQPEWTRLTDRRSRSLVERTAAMALSNRARYEVAGGPSTLSGPVPSSARGLGLPNS